MHRTLLLAMAALLALAISACGGNGTPPPTQNTGLDGQLVQGNGDRVVSAVGDGIPGAEVELINFDNGRVSGSSTTDANGRFMFRNLPNGQFLLKVHFNSSADLDGDGMLDAITTFLPIELSEDVINELTAALALEDTDGDSSNDGVKIDVRVKAGENGTEKRFIRVHRHRHGQTQVDDNGDGVVDDEFEDEDNNGLPDGTNGGGNYPQGPKLRGEIEAIGDGSVTVAGQTFIVTETTSWRIRGNRSADPGEFAVGDEVQVTSFTNQNGEKVALEIKLKKNNGNGGGDDEDDEMEVEGAIEALTADSITVDGQTFVLTANTTFLFQDKTNATFDDFAVGDVVEVKARLVDGEWIAVRVKMEEEGDDEPETRELTGVIETISESGVTIGGENFTFDAETSFLLEGDVAGALADFDEGDTVQLKAELRAGVWVVTELKLEDDDDDERTVTGAIEAIDADSVTIAGEEFAIDAGTAFKLFGGGAGTIGDFAVGANVELTADLESGVWVVREIKLTDEPVELEDFNIDFTDFGVHSGHNFYLKVKDSEGETVATATTFLITEAGFNVSLPGILTSGEEYNVDFWADVDGNGELDGTPLNGGMDHAWRLTATANDDGIDLDFAHDTNFTDIRPF